MAPAIFGLVEDVNVHGEEGVEALRVRPASLTRGKGCRQALYRFAIALFIAIGLLYSAQDNNT